MQEKHPCDSKKLPHERVCPHVAIEPHEGGVRRRTRRRGHPLMGGVAQMHRRIHALPPRVFNMSMNL